MNDLISRSELYNELGNKLTWLIAYGDYVYLDVCSDIKDVIDNMPTAYDIDKVVEEIKTLKEEALGEYNMGEYNLDNNIGNSISENYRKDMNEGRCFAYDEAIEIVKQGEIK